MTEQSHQTENPDSMLAEIESGSGGASPVRTSERFPTGAIKRVRYSHDAMIDQIIANPGVSQNNLATVFGYTPAWVSLVMSSDAFKERLEARKSELVDPVIRASVEERFKALVSRSLEVLQEKLMMPSSAIPDNLALRAAELGAKALGIGGNAPPPPPNLPSDHLDKLATRLVALQRQAPLQNGLMKGIGNASETETIDL